MAPRKTPAFLAEAKDFFSTPAIRPPVHCASPTRSSRLRQTVLGEVGFQTEAMDNFLEEHIGGNPQQDAVLIWIRNRGYGKKRNSTPDSIRQLQDWINEKRLRPILIGDLLGGFGPEKGNLIRFVDYPDFKQQFKTETGTFVASQLLMFERLRSNHRVRMSVGMQSGGMDGPALLLGLKTVSFAKLRDTVPIGQTTYPPRLEQIEKTISTYSMIPLEYKDRFLKHSDRERRALMHHLDSL